MNRADSILPNSLSVFPHMTAFDLATAGELAAVPLSQLMVYAVDLVPAEVLPILAEQFDVLGNKGWRMAHSDVERRALIKRAIELHRYKGTPWAIKQALRSIGFTNIVIHERAGGHWAQFRVNLDNNTVMLNSAVLADVISLIEEYKPARSVLEGVFITLATDDELEMIEDTAAAFDQLRVDDDVTVNARTYYDGTDNYDGGVDHSGENDVAIIS